MKFYNFLKDNSVQSKKYFFPALHNQKAYLRYNKKYKGKLPVAERAADEGLALPLYSHIDKNTILHICALLKEFLD